MRVSIRPEYDVVSFDDEDFSEENVIDTSDRGYVMIDGVGVVLADDAIPVILELTKKYFNNMEADLIFLMKEGHRPVEISKILQVPECEVVRLRKNCFRKLKILYYYEHHLNKKAFVEKVLTTVKLNEKQKKIFTMFFQFYGLRQIAEAIGSRASNVHRSLTMISRRIDSALSIDDPDRAFLNAFNEFKYLRLIGQDDYEPDQLTDTGPEEA